jgi:hypothetical protein
MPRQLYECKVRSSEITLERFEEDKQTSGSINNGETLLHILKNERIE